MGDASKLDTARRTNGHERTEPARPVNPWLLLGAGAVVVLLIVLLA